MTIVNLNFEQSSEAKTVRKKFKKRTLRRGPKPTVANGDERDQNASLSAHHHQLARGWAGDKKRIPVRPRRESNPRFKIAPDLPSLQSLTSCH